MPASARIFTHFELQSVNPQLRNFIEHRKSGLSLNHIIGCPLDCHYCVRSLWGNFDLKVPSMITTDESALQALLAHPHFEPHKTPVQMFNRATDPFLPTVKPHLFWLLEQLDRRGLRNFVTIITRYRVTEEDFAFLESLSSIRLTLFFTYSGGNMRNVEPIDPKITRGSILEKRRNSVGGSILAPAAVLGTAGAEA
jgi:DNA repair photolyase